MRAFLLVLLSILTGQAIQAAAGECQAHVTSENVGRAYRLVAQNSGVAPVHLMFRLTTVDNVASDRSWPFKILVPAGQTIQIATLYGASPNRSYSFRYSVDCSVGDPMANHNPAALYRLPFADGLSFPIGQAYRGSLTTHNMPESLYAVDFTMPVGTQVLAARGGIVIDVDLSHQYGGTDKRLLSMANVITILHADGTMASYAHLARSAPLVRVGQSVLAGQLLGYSGNTGYSSGPHLHFVVFRNSAPQGRVAAPLSLPVRFYVGATPRVFEARAGMVVTSNYSTNDPAIRMVANVRGPRGNGADYADR